MKRILNTLPFIIFFLIFGLLIKEGFGNGLDKAGRLMNPGQYFESSIARGRYAHILSVVNGNLNLTQELADFAAPDVSRTPDGRFVSIWPPGSTFVLAPFYLLGSFFDLGLFSVNIAIVLISVVNGYLLYKLVTKLGAKPIYGILATFIFLFASNVQVYSLTISQHPITTLILLLCIHLAISVPSFLKHLFFWMLIGFSVGVDLPNALIFLPLVIYLLFKHVFIVTREENDLNIRINYLLIISVFVSLIPVMLLFKYNQLTTGNYLGFGQFQSRYTYEVAQQISRGEYNPDRQGESITLPFNVNKLPQGLNTLLFSKERGLLFYSPVFFLAILGIPQLLKQKTSESKLLLSTVIISLFFYSMFSDVQGGWSFGPRYVIPLISIFSILISFAFERYGKNLLFNLALFLLAGISIAINTLGSLSTILIPPIHEASGLGLDPTINVSINHLLNKQLGSYVYNTFVSSYLTNLNYYFLVAGLMIFTLLFVVIKSFRSSK